MALVHAESLSRTYGDVAALTAVDLVVQSGESVAILGPSGSGKTTLIGLLACLDRPTRGRLRIQDLDMQALSASELARFRRERIGIVFQQFHLVPYLTAIENVMLAQYYHSMADAGEAAEVLGRFGLKQRLHHLPRELSAGEQQRVCIARAMINAPSLLLADEPTGNLDERNVDVVLDIFRQLHAAGQTLIVVTHDPRMASVCQRRVHLAHGRVVTPA